MPPNNEVFAPPNPDNIPDGGELLFSANGAIICIGIKRGGMLVKEPVWIKMHVWQAFAILAGAMTAFATNQVEQLAQRASKDGFTLM